MTRDGAARDRGPAGGAAGHEGLRHPVRAGPARVRGRVRAPDLPQRVPAGAERRLRRSCGCAAPRPRRPTSWPTLVRAAFAHRRKALPRSLEEAGGPAGVRAAARDGARGAWGTRPTPAPRPSAPQDFVAARARAGALRLRSRDACAGEAQPLPVRRAPPPRRAARDPLGVPADHAGRRGHAGARPPVARTRSCARASSGPNLAAAALAAFRDRFGWDGPPVRVTIEKHIPVSAGLGGGSADAAAVLRLAAAASRHAPAAGRAGRPRDVARRRRAVAASAPQPALVTGAGEVVEPLPARAVRGVLLAGPRRAQHRERLRARRRAGPDARRPSTDVDTDAFHNDLQAAAVDLEPEARRGARAAARGGRDRGAACRAPGRRRSACSRTRPRRAATLAERLARA